MRTMISNLPRDLIEEIISRVPLKFMKAVRLTCKTWNNLSKSEFLRKRITREGETMMIAIRNHNLYLMRVVVDGVDPSIELKGKLNCIVVDDVDHSMEGQLSFLNDEVNITEVLHFEGLLLFILRDVTRIMVWNPYWGQTVWIKLRYSHLPRGIDRFSYALGYEDKKSCRKNKLLRFIDYFFKEPENQFFWYEIYDFDCGLWTTLDVTPHWCIYCCSHGVSLKGNTYWCAAKRSSECYTNHIICFDFTRERFGPLLPLPALEVRDHEDGNWTLSCVKEEKLVALFQPYYAYELEIWITIKINVEMVSWSKFLRMDTGPRINVPHTFFIDEEKKVYMDFNEDYDSDSDSDIRKQSINIIGEAGYLKKMDTGVPEDQYGRQRDCSYVPNLVQISKPLQGKRIKESRLEKRRFNQNRSRLATIEKLLKKDRDW
ncbi:putative F-box protein [Cardamine amara subsp. amara]|uniref:F-box protein n=1 Tax=Cardamine amara subsp. amara TaxID=228776 RepID=A0ABD1BEL1_CARAN